jgi:hypothetical protein
MFDTALNDQFPAGAAAYAAYVDGGTGNQPNYAYIPVIYASASAMNDDVLPVLSQAGIGRTSINASPGSTTPASRHR